MTPKITLYAFLISHYCEKAAWGLDAAGVPYRLKCWAPGVHVILARSKAPQTTVPIMTVGHEVIQGSGRILDWTKLPGGDEKVEGRMDEFVAPAVRRMAYCATLETDPLLVRRWVLDGVPAWQKYLGLGMWPVSRQIMIKKYDATAKAFSSVVDEVDRELDWIDKLVSGRKYLRGDRLGRADITVAGLLSGLASPPEHPIYGKISWPERMTEVLGRWSGRPSIAWTRALYASDRLRGQRPRELSTGGKQRGV